MKFKMEKKKKKQTNKCKKKFKTGGERNTD